MKEPIIARWDDVDHDFIDEEPDAWIDMNGRAWETDINVSYADRHGFLWHYAGGYELRADGIMWPLFSRNDRSIQDVRLRACPHPMTWHGRAK